MLKIKGNAGITLIALIITIIVLLILAAITIGQLTSSGLFNNANTAKEKHTIEATQEQLEIDMANFEMQRLIDNSNDQDNNSTALNELKTYLEGPKFNGEYEVELFYEPFAATTTIAQKPTYALVTHLPTQFKFYVDGKLVVIGKESPNDYNAVIKYNANGGEGIMDKQSAIIDKKATLKENRFTKEGYAFIGWSLSANGEVIENNKLDVTSAEMTVYAKWGEGYTVSFDNNGGTGTMDSIQVLKGGTVTLPENKFTNSGKQFYNWNAVVNGSELIYKNREEIKPTSNITLYAKWVEATINGDDLLSVVKNNTFENDTVYYSKVNNTIYGMHVYNVSGDLEISSEIEYGNINDVAHLDTTTNTVVQASNMVVLKVNGNLNITNTGKLTAFHDESYGGPKGMLIYCTGTLTNNGTISMTGRGARANGEDVYLWKNSDGSYEFVPENGATGGNEIPTFRGYATNGNKGNDGTGRSTGGGGTGAGRSWDYAAAIGAGGQGNSYSGGSGSGASNNDGSEGGSSRFSASSSVTTKGWGGSAGAISSANTSGYGQISLGGIGNPTGGYATYLAGAATYEQNNGTGGLLMIYANTFQNNNEITANGISTGNVTSNYNRGYRIDAGGSSGGGSVNIFCNQLGSRGTITADGGAAAQLAGGNVSGAGGKGTVSIGRITNGTYVGD